MKKHAYLIAAHNEFEILKTLISLLDYEENDIYIHIDKKTKNFNKDSLLEDVKHASIEFVPSSSINWGGYSQIQYELSLLKEATKKYHDYYHLISGVDLPIKSHKEILDFFDKNYGKEFIEFDDKYEKEKIDYRIRYYHLLQDKVGKRGGFTGKFLYNIERVVVKIQKIIGVNRIKKCKEQFFKGTNWFSITHDLAIYIVNSEKQIRSQYKYTYCADEIFLQTIVKNSEFNNRVVNDCLRYIDWDRGQPYVFTEEDFDLLINSDKIWARKFSEEKNIKIVNKIYDVLK